MNKKCFILLRSFYTLDTKETNLGFIVSFYDLSGDYVLFIYICLGLGGSFIFYLVLILTFICAYLWFN